MMASGRNVTYACAPQAPRGPEEAPSGRVRRSSTVDSDTSSHGSLSSGLLSRSGSSRSHSSSDDGLLDDSLTPTPPPDADVDAASLASDFSDAECVAIADGLLRFGIRCLALDFDQTLIHFHTHGEFDGCPSDLAASVRPFFRALVPLCAARGIVVAVVTFSSQVALIADVLSRCFPGITIPVRGNELKAPRLKRSHSASALMDRASVQQPSHANANGGYASVNGGMNVAREVHAVTHHHLYNHLQQQQQHIFSFPENAPNHCLGVGFGQLLHSMSSSALPLTTSRSSSTSNNGNSSNSNTDFLAVGPPIVPAFDVGCSAPRPGAAPGGSISRHRSLDGYESATDHGALATAGNRAETDGARPDQLHLTGGATGGGTVSVVRAGSESKGKLNHISSIAAMLHAHDRPISRRSTLLLDDDERNVACALEHRIPSVLCRPSHFRRTVEDLLSMFCGGPGARR